MRTADFDYPLPPELVAQSPMPERDQSRLLVCHRLTNSLKHHQFSNILNCLHSGDVLVLNDSRVILARLRGRNTKSGGEFEILLLEENEVNDWWVMLRPGKRARLQTQIIFRDRYAKITDVHAVVIGANSEGHRRLRFTGTPNISGELERLGAVPLPPYIKRAIPNESMIDFERYQTVYAKTDGSIAAPTAGLHFTRQLLEQIRGHGVSLCDVTLHVGLGTFAPVKVENVANHLMHEERFAISEKTAHTVNTAKKERRRVIAVGTTSVRVLESAIDPVSGKLDAGSGRTRIFIHPPYRFRIVDGLLTNFHLPRSTLLMLVSAFAAPGETHGRDLILSAYAEAIRERYRFFSYGDAMLIL